MEVEELRRKQNEEILVAIALSCSDATSSLTHAMQERLVREEMERDAKNRSIKNQQS